MTPVHPEALAWVNTNRRERGLSEVEDWPGNLPATGKVRRIETCPVAKALEANWVGVRSGKVAGRRIRFPPEVMRAVLFFDAQPEEES